jgi:cystathionine beta-lyase/cystathionine gamma-synthase
MAPEDSATHNPRHHRGKEENYSIESRLIYGKNVSERWGFGRHVIPPVSASTNFRFRSVEEGSAAFRDFAERAGGKEKDSFHYIYDRLDEPNKDLLEEHLAIAEEGDVALVFATGMAAISATFSVLLEPRPDGSLDELLVHMPLYGCTNDLVRKHFEARPRYPVRSADLSDPAGFVRYVSPALRVVYSETPANPTLRLVDIAALAARIRQANAGRARPILLVVDNTFSSPFCLRPLALGADIVCCSRTKFIGGFGTVMGGAVVTKRAQMSIIGRLIQLRKDTGGSLSPTNAWHILVYGISALPLRMRRKQENALALAGFLSCHPGVETVASPGLPLFPQHDLARRQMKDYSGGFAPGNMVYFVPRGNSAADRYHTAVHWMDRIARNAYTIALAVSLGQIRTLIEHPSGMTHAVVSKQDRDAGHIDPGGVRISVGIAEPEDLLRDLTHALAGRYNETSSYSDM